MLRGLLSRLAVPVDLIFQRPLKVLFICLVLVIAGLILDGSLFRLWRLAQDSDELNSRMVKLVAETQSLDVKIKRAEDPNFIELQAREKYDLAGEGDLIFVFSDEE